MFEVGGSASEILTFQDAKLDFSPRGVTCDVTRFVTVALLSSRFLSSTLRNFYPMARSTTTRSQRAPKASQSQPRASQSRRGSRRHDPDEEEEQEEENEDEEEAEMDVDADLRGGGAGGDKVCVLF